MGEPALEGVVLRHLSCVMWWVELVLSLADGCADGDAKDVAGLGVDEEVICVIVSRWRSVAGFACPNACCRRVMRSTWSVACCR